MSEPIIAALFNQVLDCVEGRLTVDAARQLVNLRLDRQSQAYLDTLADKSTEGALSPVEREEYRALVKLLDRVSILQSRARQLLAKKRRTSVS
jgi:hypothetical protein